MKQIKKKCDDCGNEMIRHPSAKYCSDCVEKRNKLANRNNSLHAEILNLIESDTCYDKNCGLKWSLRNLLKANIGPKQLKK